MRHKLKRLPSKETRGTLRLASSEAETAMMRVVGICNDPELIPPDEMNVLHQVGAELEDATARLYAMSERTTGGGQLARRVALDLPLAA